MLLLELSTYLILFLTVTSTKGSDIVFVSTSSSILPPVTKNITLKCSLEDSASLPIAVGKRDVTHTDTDVLYVTSIVVMHEGVDIASISEHVPVQVLNKASNLKASGKIDNAPQRGYIEMDWLYPTDADAGEYQCEVTGINKKGHSFKFSKSLEVILADVTVSDLSAEIAMMKKVMDALQMEKTAMQGQITSLGKEKDALRQDVTSLQNDRTTMQGQISTMSGQISSLTNEKNALKTRMSAVETRSLATRHVQRSNCHWSGWVNGWDAEYRYQSPTNMVIVGVHSYHDNGKEDRRFEFLYCELTSPHP